MSVDSIIEQHGRQEEQTAFILGQIEELSPSRPPAALQSGNKGSQAKPGRDKIGQGSKGVRGLPVPPPCYICKSTESTERKAVSRSFGLRPCLSLVTRTQHD